MKMRMPLLVLLVVVFSTQFMFSEDDIPKNNTAVYVVAESAWFYVNESDIGKSSKEVKGKDWKQLFFGNKVTVTDNKKVKDVIYLCVQLPDRSKCWGRSLYFTEKFIVITKDDLLCFTQPDESYRSRTKLQKGFLGYFIKETGGYIYADFRFYMPKDPGKKSVYVGKVWIKSNDSYTDDITTAGQADYLTTAYNYLYGKKVDNVSALKNLKKGLELNDGEETQITDVLQQLKDALEGNGTTVSTTEETVEKKTETVVGNYYMPNVRSLRIRDSSSIDGKVIRTLEQGEKLKLLEKGNSEVINGVSGTWGKYETTKGEVGWCFDAYLTEYTD